MFFCLVSVLKRLMTAIFHGPVAYGYVASIVIIFILTLPVYNTTPTACAIEKSAYE